MTVVLKVHQHVTGLLLTTEEPFVTILTQSSSDPVIKVFSRDVCLAESTSVISGNFSKKDLFIPRKVVCSFNAPTGKKRFYNLIVMNRRSLEKIHFENTCITSVPVIHK